ncbi:MAG: DNA-binding protein [Comamonas thiooxydans]
MAAPLLTQEIVNQAAEKLLAQHGKRPSNRAVLAAIGSGSMTTVSKFMNNWRSEAGALGANPQRLPQKLLQELESLQRDAEKAVRDECAVDLENARDSELLLIQENEQLSAQVAALQAELQAAREDSTTAHANFAQLQADAATLKRELESERTTANELRIDLAKSSLRLEETVPQLKQELKECRSQLDIARKLQTDAELKAAVAQERAAGLAKRMEELK